MKYSEFYPGSEASASPDSSENKEAVNVFYFEPPPLKKGD
jgi:hypothetical protein